jgi:hypothetical protein
VRRSACCGRPFARATFFLLSGFGAALLVSNPVFAVQPPDVASTPAADLELSQKAAPGVQPEVEVPFSLRPYRVRLSVSLTGSVGGRSFDQAILLDELRQAVSRMYGRMWRLDLHEADWLRPGTPIQIAELKVEDLINGEGPEHALDRYPEAECDKAMLVGVSATTAGFEVICREYDTRTHELSAALRTFTPDSRQIAIVTARLVRDSFRPYLKYSRRYVDNDNRVFIQLQVQAGEISAPDPTAEQIRTGDVLRPFQRFMNRKDPTRLRQLRFLPLTYVRVTSVDQSVTRGLATGVLLTHGPVSPFGMRGRNLKQVALRQRPAAQSSTVRLVERSVDNKPLVCQRLSVVYKLRRQDRDELDQVKLVSDRNGEVTITAHDDFPTLWLYVYSGQKLLASVPYAPGLVPFDTIELPDDSIRLSVEGDLQLFQDELVDSIALRAVQFSLASRAAEEGRLEDLRRQLEEYDANPTLDEFRDSLKLIRDGATSRANRSNNRPALQAVEQMCGRMLDTLNSFFSEEKIDNRQFQLDALRARLEAEKGS